MSLSVYCSIRDDVSVCIEYWKLPHFCVKLPRVDNWRSSSKKHQRIQPPGLPSANVW